MELKTAKRRYNSQRANAKRRGIAWAISFEEWLRFWGKDLENRGAGHDKLCMQRFHDAGPYHPDNCRKDYPRKNAKTAGVIRRGKNAQPHTIDWDAVYFAVKAHEQST